MSRENVLILEIFVLDTGSLYVNQVLHSRIQDNDEINDAISTIVKAVQTKENRLK